MTIEVTFKESCAAQLLYNAVSASFLKKSLIQGIYCPMKKSSKIRSTMHILSLFVETNKKKLLSRHMLPSQGCLDRLPELRVNHAVNSPRKRCANTPIHLNKHTIIFPTPISQPTFDFARKAHFYYLFQLNNEKPLHLEA